MFDWIISGFVFFFEKLSGSQFALVQMILSFIMSNQILFHRLLHLKSPDTGKRHILLSIKGPHNFSIHRSSNPAVP
ncbi:hypothetical protein DLD82_11175 [Methanospirillum stamsii]|uniref:Uncharacterized protein n=1 Tax=Methanospirillum stamsii TaxID=1277351 RepID=A0A2V2MYD0_9EURY|nr:hypothetical protein DLD82_11175 [Methanospirillum stamsii]